MQAADRANTVASAIRITEPVHRADVEEIVARSGGSVVTVADDDIVAARDLLGREEGIYCEPASAAGIAGLAQGTARDGERVVCVVTGHGLKDPA
jgi:threonine synthase